MSATHLQDGSWHLLTLLDQAPGLKVMAETLADMVDEGQPVVVGTADLKYSNGLYRFQDRHPDRFIQFGVSEQNMVTAAAGIATTGLRPHVATFASFLALLCCEQIRTDIAYSAQPVRLIGHHAGLTLGFYGTSHHATEDIAIMRSIADLDVVAPADPTMLGAAIRAYGDQDVPAYFRIGRGREPVVYPADLEFERGRAIRHETGDQLTIIATGSMVHPSLQAVESLRQEGRSVGLIDMHTIKPLDVEAILDAARGSAAILTVEEHNVLGGLGGAVAEVIAEERLDVLLRRHGIPDEYVPVGPPTHLYRHYGLDGEGIAERAKAVIAEA